MTRARTAPSRTARPTRRTKIVWTSFTVAMTVVVGLLTLQDVGTASGGFLVAANLSVLGTQPTDDPVFQTDVELDRQRWTGIVIHHSGEPGGDAESISRLQVAQGLQGLGYHFVIGNGNGMGDGVIHVGYRWNQQLPGAHVAGPLGEVHNQHSIGICLVGNGNRRPFTEAQMTRLISLVQRLQRELRIPADAVYLDSDLTPDVSSPGRFFSRSRLEEQLLDVPR